MDLAGGYERAGISGGEGEWKIFKLYAKCTCFGLVVKQWGMVKEVEGTMGRHRLFYRMVHVIQRNIPIIIPTQVL